MLRESGGEVSSRCARLVRVAGTIQGVGFRPFVYRLAQRHGLQGWVRNEGRGVVIHVEGDASAVDAFVEGLGGEAPPAARIASVRPESAAFDGTSGFHIRESDRGTKPTARISPDLAVCADCLNEMRDPDDGRHGYPYVNCTNCGPRYSIIRELPYDRPYTTMAAWTMCSDCTREYEDPHNRRFHAQPIACPVCGPAYRLRLPDDAAPQVRTAAIVEAAGLLREGRLLAVKGIGGYHIACDALNANAVARLRLRKFRKEKPFALMVPDIESADELVVLSATARSLLESPERPIVVAPARRAMPGIAPGIDELGVMLPYAPLHVLLFDAEAPAVLVMTSANRSSEPIAYDDADAFDRLSGIADAFLVGDRPIARRVDDSVVLDGVSGPTILRRSRGYAPGPVATLPAARPILAVGADLKNTVTLLVGGEAFMSQHIGDLDQYGSLTAFEETIDDLLRMYEVERADLLVVHDAHPQYASTRLALEMNATHLPVQHHEAHVASVLAERGAFGERVLGVALDGTGYGTDGAIWGGELFAGSLTDGFERVGHLRTARLPGGDAAARHPVQAAAGFLGELGDDVDFRREPFSFPDRFASAVRLLETDVRVFKTTSAGRLFDAVSALLGFTRPISYEAQAAIYLEQLAGRSSSDEVYPFPDLDYRPLLRAVIADRLIGRPKEDVARSFHLGLARGLAGTVIERCRQFDLEAIVLSGGVFQNRLLHRTFVHEVGDSYEVWTNRTVPCNDGGISLGQAAVAALRD